MKISEMNVRQKKAFKNIYYAARNHIGGLENGTYDNPEGSQAYNDYLTALNDHAGLVAEIYHMATTDIYDEGFVSFGKGAEAYMRDIRFCGRDWLMEPIKTQVKKLGY